ncbi:hypothetical protein KQ313_05540 [Synechococcus sp. CS-1325]|uniref:hypothetical protein n=1 Tax=unclassified Synechococcus TaxID=2626047 RepID=UPI000DB711D5|nr:MULTISPECIES: hypothetical protein [unclassified Synechococcus]PZV01909.1 MAG: hypothetical protein DCF24_02995 [Cyanobium sp.]MCT0199137.1 hypothetical protein [Synechococcus sp. CS-1325]MCT0214684.1 hypothetical protein [Synechococcus sp. CS-1326]MCT0231126.1 hypothetical protein [Synechococcus sp. CS-1324]MCT0234018.1 hypothetical protein [Synechococcus sp. CS-1327]
MAADPLDALRLSLMQDILPVGMAVVERVRRGGPRQVVEAFTGSDDPLGQLRQEGDPAARAVRESLDQIQPGLGNPVMKVEVRDIPTSEAVVASGGGSDPQADAEAEGDALNGALIRIADRLAELQRRLEA